LIKCFIFIIKYETFSILGDSLSTVEVYNPLTERWELAEAMSILRSRVGVAVLSNKLYAFGGYNGIERLSSVEVFDPTTKSWNIVSPMHRKRRLAILIHYRYLIY
jgi:kelch-like protein 18